MEMEDIKNYVISYGDEKSPKDAAVSVINLKDKPAYN
jgi:hypothetical protein